LPREDRRRIELAGCRECGTELRDLFLSQCSRIDLVQCQRQRSGWQPFERQVSAQDAGVLSGPRNGELLADLLAAAEEDAQEARCLRVPGSFKAHQGRIGSEDGGMSGGLEGKRLVGTKAG